MFRTLTLLQAAPYVVGAWVLSLGGAWWLGHSDGYADSEATHQAAGVRQFVRAVEQAAEVGRAIYDIGAKLREQLADSRIHETTSRQTVRKALDAHPDFAAIRRPAELQRVRRADLERIARAAEAD